MKVMAWKRVAGFLCETLGGTMDAEERIEEMESELGRLMVGLDQKVESNFNKNRNQVRDYVVVQSRPLIICNRVIVPCYHAGTESFSFRRRYRGRR